MSGDQSLREVRASERRTARARRRPRLRRWLCALLGPFGICLVGAAACAHGSSGLSVPGGWVGRQPCGRLLPRPAVGEVGTEPPQLRLDSPFRGVSRHGGTSKWQAHIPDPSTGEPISLGLFGSERDAAKAYDRAALACGVQGGVVTNFPADTYEPEEVQEAQAWLRDHWRSRPSSQYYGVYRTRGSKMWKAEIELYGVKQFLDNFDNEVEAAHAVDHAIRSTGAERALQLKLLNFMNDGDYFDEDTWEQEPIPRGWTSRFLGVSYHQPTNKFLAKIGRKHLGLFATEVEAAKAFDGASQAVGGPTNFPPREG